MDRSKFFKMLLKGVCNVIFLSSVITLVVLIGEGSLFQKALAQMSEMNNDEVILKTVDAGSFIGQRKPLSEAVLKPKDPNELPRSYFSFKGIPYAKPPLGPELRWKEPQPAEIRQTPKVTTEFKTVCSQWDSERRRVIGSQDCLYLNVFTPYVPSSVKRPQPMAENSTSWTVENRNLLPVLVYVHGGEFLSGSGNLYGPERFMRENVVLVTFSYRLGIFGFLSNGKTSLSGNFGLQDQLEALKWVQQNIYRFGGNPLRVAVFGNVEHLLLLPGTKGLFQEAIVSSVSTSVFNPTMGKSVKPEKVILKVATAADCPVSDEEEMLDCLRLVDTDRLIRIQQRMHNFFSYPSVFGPVVDNDWEEFPLLKDDPEVLFEQGSFATVPILIGTSAFEGFNPFLEFYAELGSERDAVLQDEDTLKGKLKESLLTILGLDGNLNDAGFGRIFESIWRYYFGEMQKESWAEKDPARVLWKLFRVFGDLTMQSGHRKLVQLLSSKAKAPVFNYVFNHSIDHFSTYLQERLTLLGNKERDPHRSIHTNKIPPWKELYYLFEPVDFDNTSYKPRQLQMLSNSSGNPANTINGNNLGEPATEPNKVYLPQQFTRNFTTEDEKLSDFLVKLWITFANYGSPKQIIAKTGNHTRWSRVTEDRLNYYVLGANSHPMKADFRKAECQFWSSILPQIKELSEKITELEPFPLLFWVFVGLTSFLILMSIILICCICCSREPKDDTDTNFGEDNVVFLKRIPEENL